MTIYINGEPRDVPEGSTVAEVIRLAGLTASPCAAEVNRRIVPWRERDHAVLAEGDRIEIVSLIGGG
ncbi:MAG: sulfur carrier protein ThiS [Phycisphaeraceae bacterium]|nr:MAG: sulfur carrier protein ThiS [Phycisphaeraceae bacterium]